MGNDNEFSGDLRSLPKGYQLLEFRFEKILGQGAFGITYLVIDTMLNRKMAIKEYFPREFAIRESTSFVKAAGGDKEDGDNFSWGLSRFLEEARVLAIFNHPNIVPVRRFFKENGTAYLVMDYCEGTPLDKFITENGPLNKEKLDKILYPLLDGLEKIHSANFLHRDIKPANIFIRSDGSPVLLDFGAARQELVSHSKSITTMATPGYAAFEQYSTHGKQGPWTDIYGLAATLYKAVTGEKPLDSPDRILEDNLVPSKIKSKGKFSENFLSAIDIGMSVRPNNRPQSILEWVPLFGDKEFGLLSPNTTSSPVPLKTQRANSDELQDSSKLTSQNKSSSKLILALLSIFIVVGIYFVGRNFSGGLDLASNSDQAKDKKDIVVSIPLPVEKDIKPEINPKKEIIETPKPVKDLEIKSSDSITCVDINNAANWTNCVGTITFPPKGNQKSEKYSGAFKSGLFDGKGTYSYASGATYTGEFKDNKRNGTGKLVTPDGYNYSGSWKDDRYEGNGTLVFPNQDKYVGQFSAGKFNGRGTYTFPDGRKYVGNYLNDKANGLGVFYYADGRKYEGNHVDGQMNGEGTLFAANGSKIYSGLWENGKAKEADNNLPKVVAPSNNLGQCNSFAADTRKLLPRKIDDITIAKDTFCYLGISKPVFVYKYEIDSPQKFDQNIINTLKEKLRNSNICRADVKQYLPIVDIELQYSYSSNANNFEPNKPIGKLIYSISDCP